MFIKLINKEIKHQLRSITFIIFCIFVGLFYVTQFIGDTKKDTLEPIDIFDNLEEGSDYFRYSIDEEIDYQMELNILKKLLDRDIEKQNTIMIEHPIEYKKINQKQLDYMASVKQQLADELLQEMEYKNILDNLQDKLGKTTIYYQTFIKDLANKEIKNKRKNQLFKDVIEIEKISGSYARLFCDYIGIGVGFFAVFISAFSLIRDKRYRTQEIVYSKSISSLKYVLSKYMGDIILMLGVVFLIATYTTYDFHIRFNNIDYLAFFRYSIIWVFPTITLVTSLAYLLQLLFNSGIVPIIVQFAYWLYSMAFSNNQYSITKYIIRYNKITSYSEYQKVAGQIMLNRGFILLASILLLILAIVTFEKKRGNICE